MKLQQNPLCEYCLNEGRLTVAVAIDHIIPISKGGDPYPPLDHVLSCCTSCHNRKTRIVEQQGKSSRPKASAAATCMATRSTKPPVVPGTITNNDTNPIGYATLREALAVIIEHKTECARARSNSGRGKLSLSKPVNTEPHKSPPMR
jgi:hypothetical protein